VRDWPRLIEVVSLDEAVSDPAGGELLVQLRGDAGLADSGTATDEQHFGPWHHEVSMKLSIAVSSGTILAAGAILGDGA